MNETIVLTVYGQVQGYFKDSGITVFKGIPYGAVTGSENRIFEIKAVEDF